MGRAGVLETEGERKENCLLLSFVSVKDAIPTINIMHESNNQSLRNGHRKAAKQQTSKRGLEFLNDIIACNAPKNPFMPKKRQIHLCFSLQ